MKREYKPWLILLLVEFIFVFIMNKANVHFDSLMISAIGTFLFFLPIVALLVLLSKDEAISEKGRALCKFAYCFLAFCYLLGLVLKILVK